MSVSELIRCGHCRKLSLIDTKAKKPKEAKEERQIRNIIQEYLNRKKQVFIQKLNEILRSQGMPAKALPKKTVRDAIDEMNDLARGTKNIMEVSVLNEILNNVIRNSYFTGLDELSAQVDVNFIPNTPAVRFIQDYMFRQVKDMNDEIASDLQDVFTRSLMEGADISSVKKRVLEVFDVGGRRAEMIARTEYARAFGSGRQQGMEDSVGLGITGLKYWDAFYRDERTSEICNTLHEMYSVSMGRGIPVDQPFRATVTTGVKKKRTVEVSVMQEPAHINCRSRTVFKPIPEEKLAEMVHPDYTEFL